VATGVATLGGLVDVGGDRETSRAATSNDAGVGASKPANAPGIRQEAIPTVWRLPDRVGAVETRTFSDSHLETRRMAPKCPNARGKAPDVVRCCLAENGAP
jgi:hypothetical protein